MITWRTGKNETYKTETRLPGWLYEGFDGSKVRFILYYDNYEFRLNGQGKIFSEDLMTGERVEVPAIAPGQRWAQQILEKDIQAQKKNYGRKEILVERFRGRIQGLNLGESVCESVCEELKKCLED